MLKFEAVGLKHARVEQLAQGSSSSDFALWMNVEPYQESWGMLYYSYYLEYGILRNNPTITAMPQFILRIAIGNTTSY